MQRVHAKTGSKSIRVFEDSSVPNNPPRLREFILRERFSSKHLAYPPRMIAVLSVVYLFYACLTIMTAASFFINDLAATCLLIWIAKILAELSFHSPFETDGRSGAVEILHPLTPFHLLYVVFMPVLQINRPPQVEINKENSMKPKESFHSWEFFVRGRRRSFGITGLRRNQGRSRTHHTL
jgi:hypothetical protein